MKIYFFWTILAFAALMSAGPSLYAQSPASNGCPIVPGPQKVSVLNGQLPLASLKEIRVNDPAFNPVAHYFQQEILEHTESTIPISAAAPGKGAHVVFNKDSNLSKEAYRLKISPTQIEITASTPQGSFYGAVSLLQLIRIAALGKPGTADAVLPCWQIEDAPQLAWRGLMLDESRHFFGINTVKKILDWMAFYKLNRFHWHLTDVPGWRIEIKSFPKLALVGGIGNHTNPLAPAKYYTQDEIREIIRYAAERFIEVIPEIDMPGHATSANRAYPEYSGGGSKNYPDFTFNPGKEETYRYLSKIIREVDVLFPSKMIHLGGDEVHFGNENWKKDAHVQALMKENRFTDLKQVEQYFVERMADSIVQLNSKVLGWDEIASTKIDPANAVIFWWRHDKPEALKMAIDNHYNVVLCPRIPLYFDFVQDSSHISGRKWKGAYSDLEAVYHFSAENYPDIIRKNNRDQILGIQANLWSETIASEARLEFMLFPRIAALAEAAWTHPATRKYSEFLERLSYHKELFRKGRLYYYDPVTPELTPEVVR